MVTIEKTWEELDWAKVELGCSNWIVGNGGGRLSDGQWSITEYDPALKIFIRYQMPECVNEMMHRQYQAGVTFQAERVRRALGL